MPPSTLATVTLGVTELLEMILENATPNDLFLWQRVNETWQAAIQTSPRLQEKLSIGIRVCKDEDEQRSAVWTPFMELFIEYHKSDYHFISEDAFGGKASYPTASWKQMSVTSPAITALQVSLTRTETRVMYYHKLVCESGVTLGQLAKSQEKGNVLGADFDKGEYLCIWNP